MTSSDWWVRYMPSAPGALAAIVAMSSNAGSTGRDGFAYGRATFFSRAAASAGVPIPSAPSASSCGAP
jgi:hypothetical protein